MKRFVKLVAKAKGTELQTHLTAQGVNPVYVILRAAYKCAKDHNIDFDDVLKDVKAEIDNEVKE